MQKVDLAKTPLRELDRELLQLYAQGSMPAKLKDVFPSRPYKVNLYVEGGHLVRGRGKITGASQTSGPGAWPYQSIITASRPTAITKSISDAATEANGIASRGK